MVPWANVNLPSNDILISWIHQYDHHNNLLTFEVEFLLCPGHDDSLPATES